MARTLYVGVISGTSVDGLDFALLDIGAKISLIASQTQHLAPALRERLLALGQPGHDDLDNLGETDRELGATIGEGVSKFLRTAGCQPDQVAAIGSHGQTVRHRPDGAQPFTLQIGDPNQIAETTGITCVADFRRRDMAAGGQGAPLVPPFHAALFRDAEENRVILNVGGISNITVLPANPAEPVSGFDTGPGNALLDSWIADQRLLDFDKDGLWAAQGTVHTGLLEQLLQDPYLARHPPKSTGREHYNLQWLQRHELGDISAVDVQATLLEFTAVSIVDAVAKWAGDCQRLLVCGGGRLNVTLMERLEDLVSYPLAPTDEYGVDGDAIEAAAFAWLARQTLLGQAGNEPAVTGANGPRVLGAIYPGA